VDENTNNDATDLIAHNRIFNIVEKYKTGDIKNIVYFSPEMIEGFWEDKSV